MNEYKQTNINGYDIELEIEEIGEGESFSNGTVNKGNFYVSLQRLMEGYPLEDGCGEELIVSDGTFKRIERWALANGY